MFLKKIKSRIEELEKKYNKLEETIVTNELKYLREENEKFKDVKKQLADIQLEVDKATIKTNMSTGARYLAVTYKLPRIEIYFDDNNEPIKNDFFYAVNNLGLISPDDEKKLIKVIQQIEEEGNR